MPGGSRSAVGPVNDKRLAELIEPVTAAAGLDLESVRMSVAGKRRLLRIVVDGDGGVSLDDAADVSREQVVASFRKPRKADPRTQATGDSLRRVIPIIVAQQIVREQGARSVNVPIEAHILAIADAYQKLISGADGKVMSPLQAEQEILAGAGQRFHPGVVDAFAKAFGARSQGAGA